MLSLADKDVDFRVSTLPTAHGESVVLRVLDRSSVSLNLENLGLLQNSTSTLKKPSLSLMESLYVLVQLELVRQLLFMPA